MLIAQTIKQELSPILGREFNSLLPDRAHARFRDIQVKEIFTFSIE